MSFGGEEFVIELWAGIKPYVSKGDRENAAISVVSTCDMFGLADGLETAVDIDKDLKAAVKAHFGVEDDEDLDDEYDSEW